MEMGNIAQEIIKKSEVHYKTEYNDYKTILDEMDNGKFDTIYEVARFAYEPSVFPAQGKLPPYRGGILLRSDTGQPH